MLMQKQSIMRRDFLAPRSASRVVCLLQRSGSESRSDTTSRATCQHAGSQIAMCFHKQ